MNFKKIIKESIKKLYPEIENGTLKPHLAVVTAIPDAPNEGNASNLCSMKRPYYAITCQLLEDDGKTIDKEMPALQDVPIALNGASSTRGFYTFPQVGTIVEIAFAYGKQTMPFVRSVLPLNLEMTDCSLLEQKWSQNKVTYQSVDAVNNWIRKTPAIINDEASTLISHANQIWLGNKSNNTLTISSNVFKALIDALNILAVHTHDEKLIPVQSAAIILTKAAVELEKELLDNIKL